MSSWPTGMKKQVSMVHEDGLGIAYTALDACKDALMAKICRQLYPDYANLNNILPGIPLSALRANMTSPGFVLYVGSKDRERTALKFTALIHKLESLLEIPEAEQTKVELPTVLKEGKTAPMVARVSQWWLKSVVNTSFYINVMRCAPFMKLGEGWNRFVKRMISRAEANIESTNKKAKALWDAQREAAAKEIKPDSVVAGAVDQPDDEEQGGDKFKPLTPIQEGSYFHQIGTEKLTRFMKRSLPAQSREGFSDWLLYTQGKGIVNYHPDMDTSPTTEKELWKSKVEDPITKAQGKLGYKWVEAGK